MMDEEHADRRPQVRIAEFSVAVTVVDHVGVRFPQSWGLMEAISEACGISV